MYGTHCAGRGPGRGCARGAAAASVGKGASVPSHSSEYKADLSERLGLARTCRGVTGAGGGSDEGGDCNCSSVGFACCAGEEVWASSTGKNAGRLADDREEGAWEAGPGANPDEGARESSAVVEGVNPVEGAREGSPGRVAVLVAWATCKGGCGPRPAAPLLLLCMDGGVWELGGATPCLPASVAAGRGNAAGCPTSCTPSNPNSACSLALEDCDAAGGWRSGCRPEAAASSPKSDSLEEWLESCGAGSGAVASSLSESV